MAISTVPGMTQYNAARSRAASVKGDRTVDVGLLVRWLLADADAATVGFELEFDTVARLEPLAAERALRALVDEAARCAGPRGRIQASVRSVSNGIEAVEITLVAAPADSARLPAGNVDATLRDGAPFGDALAARCSSLGHLRAAQGREAAVLRVVVPR